MSPASLRKTIFQSSTAFAEHGSGARLALSLPAGGKGFEIITGEVILRIVRADAKIARMLDVSRNTPLLGTWGKVFSSDGQLLHVCNQIGYGENFEFIVR